MGLPTFKTKHRSYKSLSPEIRRLTLEAVNLELNRAFYQRELQRAASKKAIENGGSSSFNFHQELALLSLAGSVMGLYLVPNKIAVDRARHRRIVEAKAQRIAEETNAPVWRVRAVMLHLMKEFV